MASSPHRLRKSHAVGLLAAALSVTPACRPSPPNAAERAAQAAQEGYPARYPRVDRASRDERERAFRARNPGPWVSVALDPYGFATYVTRSDPPGDAAAAGSRASWKQPPFSPEELAYYRDLLARNAELFGLADPAIAASAGDATGIRIEQRFLGKPIAAISVGRYGPSGDEPGGTFISGHHWPRIVEPRELLSDDEIASHVVGQEGVVVLQCQRRPCDPAGPETICPSDPPPARASHTVRRKDVRVTGEGRVVHSQAGHGPAEVRVLASVNLHAQPCPPEPVGCDVRSEKCPLSLVHDLGGGQGWAVDRATGEILREPYLGASE